VLLYPVQGHYKDTRAKSFFLGFFINSVFYVFQVFCAVFMRVFVEHRPNPTVFQVFHAVFMRVSMPWVNQLLQLPHLIIRQLHDVATSCK
jgi:hypothetical protein